MEVPVEGRTSLLIREVPGYERYFVTEDGRLFKELKMHTRKKYTNVRLWDSDNQKSYFTGIHRLVAMCYIDNPDNKPFVNHQDGDPSNNHVSNLEWCTNSENVQHAYDIGLGYKIVKPVRQVSLNGEVIARYKSISEASRQTGVNLSHICQCCRGNRKTNGGYRWEYDK